MSAEYRNPLHPKSLTREELVPRRRIVRFNIYAGIQGKYIVTGFPEEGPYGPQVRLRVLDADEEGVHYLGDLGASPFMDGRWNEQNFVVDISDINELPAELLPRPLPEIQRFQRWMIE